METQRDVFVRKHKKFIKKNDINDISVLIWYWLNDKESYGERMNKFLHPTTPDKQN